MRSKGNPRSRPTGSIVAFALAVLAALLVPRERRRRDRRRAHPGRQPDQEGQPPAAARQPNRAPATSACSTREDEAAQVLLLRLPLPAPDLRPRQRPAGKRHPHRSREHGRRSRPHLLPQRRAAGSPPRDPLGRHHRRRQAGAQRPLQLPHQPAGAGRTARRAQGDLLDHDPARLRSSSATPSRSSASTKSASAPAASALPARATRTRARTSSPTAARRSSPPAAAACSTPASSRRPATTS